MTQRILQLVLPPGQRVSRDAVRSVCDFNDIIFGRCEVLTWLAQQLAAWESAFSVFQYITLRGILSAMTALVISTVVGPRMIRWLQEMQIGQAVRVDGPQSHLSKAGTPTMGGALIIVAIASGTLLWGTNPFPLCGRNTFAAHDPVQVPESERNGMCSRR